MGSLLAAGGPRTMMNNYVGVRCAKINRAREIISSLCVGGRSIAARQPTLSVKTRNIEWNQRCPHCVGDLKRFERSCNAVRMY